MVDPHVGDGGPNSIKYYWTRGEGLSKWVGNPHPWTALFHHLQHHMSVEMAKRCASQWFFEVFGFWSGDRKGKNPVGPG